MWKPKANFPLMLALLGAVLLGVVLAHVFGRGPRIYPMEPVWGVPLGDVKRGKIAIVHHGCASCHVVPGIRFPQGRVGPRLDDLSEQVYIAGVLPNTPDNLVRWLQDPQGINPMTAMPTQEITEGEARDMAAYLLQSDQRDWAWRWRWLIPP